MNNLDIDQLVRLWIYWSTYHHPEAIAIARRISTELTFHHLRTIHVDLQRVITPAPLPNIAYRTQTCPSCGQSYRSGEWHICWARGPYSNQVTAKGDCPGNTVNIAGYPLTITVCQRCLVCNKDLGPGEVHLHAESLN